MEVLDRIGKMNSNRTGNTTQARLRSTSPDSHRRRTLLKTIGVGLGAATIGSSPGLAVKEDYPIVLEDAESGDLSRYSGEFSWTADKGGDGSWTTTTDPDDPNGAVLNGNASMKGHQAAHGGYHTIVTRDQTVQQGDSLQARVYHPHKHTYTGLLFGVQSTDHPYPCYRLRIDNGGSPTVALEKIPPSGPIESHNLPDDCILAYTDCEPVEDTVYTVEWDWNDDGTIPFTVYNPDDSVLIDEPDPSPDTEFTKGGFGFMVSKSNPNADDMTAIVDDYVITSSDSTTSSNSAPSASDDRVSVRNGQTVTIDVLANDPDSDGSLDAGSITVVSTPTNGTTSVNADGTIDYTHDGGDTSSDSFTYTVDDDEGATSNEATVSISIESDTDTSLWRCLVERLFGRGPVIECLL